MNYKYLLFSLCVGFLFFSCEKDIDCCPMPAAEAAFESGIVVLNEGNFGSSNASVHFINDEDDNNQPLIFSKINGSNLGDTAQSIEFHENLGVIVVNGSNKIEIVNRFTFKSLATISSNLHNPRYAEVIGDKLYISNWGDGMNADDDFIAVFDLKDFTFMKSISVAEGPEKMLASNNSLFVAHKGGFSFNNIISVINSESDMVIKEIEAGDLPDSMEIKGNELWVLSSGKPSYADTETPGNLTKIDIATLSVLGSFNLPEPGMHPSNLSIINNEALFTMGKDLYRYNTESGFQPTPEFSFDEVAVLYGFEIHDGQVFIASPRADFSGNGNLFVYDLNNGSLQKTYTVGINPNGIYFN